jgi:hypothetical protein
MRAEFVIAAQKNANAPKRRSFIQIKVARAKRGKHDHSEKNSNGSTLAIQRRLGMSI